MTTTTASNPTAAWAGTLSTLALIEGARLARHPMFLLGTALGIFVTAMTLLGPAVQPPPDGHSVVLGP